MSSSRQMKLGAFMRPTTIHTGAWRYPGAYKDANFNLDHLTYFAQRLEDAKFDAFFMADHLAVLNMPVEALKRSHTVTSFDPLTLLPALAMKTKHLGLIATASTTFEPAYMIARRFASLDHISAGRAGWNIVTTSNPDAALNFGLDEQMEHDERYARAREFYDVVTGLWDSWADDAFLRDAESGVFFDPGKMHVLNHKGRYLSVRGPLNVARPVQGWPVIVQAGASEAGRQLAAETAEVVFAAGSRLVDDQAFYRDVKGRAERAGRDPDVIKVLPGAFVVVGDSDDEAREKRLALDSLVHYQSAIARDQPESIRTRTNRGPGEARKSHRAPVGAAARRLFRARFRRLDEDRRRSDGAMVRRARLGRVQRAVSLPAAGAGGFCRQDRPGVATPGPVPPRIRGADAARQSRAQAAVKQILRLNPLAVPIELCDTPRAYGVESR
jgi:FMN-dependent oxidoreductase (nitrilotriacetate monooxygenase family)